MVWRLPVSWAEKGREGRRRRRCTLVTLTTERSVQIPEDSFWRLPPEGRGQKECPGPWSGLRGAAVAAGRLGG